MKLIESTNGFIIQVSDEDFEHLMGFSWHVLVRNGKPKKRDGKNKSKERDCYGP